MQVAVTTAHQTWSIQTWAGEDLADSRHLGDQSLDQVSLQAAAIITGQGCQARSKHRAGFAGQSANGLCI